VLKEEITRPPCRGFTRLTASGWIGELLHWHCAMNWYPHQHLRSPEKMAYSPGAFSRCFRHWAGAEGVRDFGQDGLPRLGSSYRRHQNWVPYRQRSVRCWTYARRRAYPYVR